MRVIRTFPRHERFSLRERRLLAEVSAVELANQAFEYVKDKAPNIAELKTVLGKVPVADQGKFVEAFKNRLGGLDANVRAVISENLKALDVKTLETAVASNLDALKATVGEGAKAIAKEKQDWTEWAGEKWNETTDWVSKSSLNPETWSPQTQKYATIGLATAGVGLIAIGAFKMTRWFFFGSKAHRDGNEDAKWKGAVDTTKGAVSTVSSGFHNALLYGGLAVGAVLAYFGIKAGYDMYEKFRSLTEVAGKGLQELTTMKDKITAQVQDLYTKGVPIPPELQKQLDAVNAAISSMAGQIDTAALATKSTEELTAMKKTFTERVTGLSGKAKEELAKRIIQVEEALAAKKQKKEEGKTESRPEVKTPEESKTAQKPPPSEGKNGKVGEGEREKKNEPVDPTNQELKKEAKEAGKKAAERAGEIFIGKYLVNFEDNPNITWAEGDSAKNHEPQIVGILNTWMNDKSMTMGRIYGAYLFGMTGEREGFRKKLGELSPTPIKEKDDPAAYANHFNSVELIVRACKRHKAAMEKIYKSKNPGATSIDDMTFSDFMRNLSSVHRPMSLMHDQIEKYGMDPKDWNLEEIGASIGEDPLAKLDIAGMVKTSEVFAKFGDRLKGKEAQMKEKLENFSFTEAISILAKSTLLNLNPNANVASVRAVYEGIVKNPPLTLTEEDIIALAVIESILKNLPTAVQLQPFFHGVFPVGTYVDPQANQRISPENQKIIDGYVNNTMSFARAARLAQYKRMIDSGNPAGVVLLQADILKFIREKEPGLFGNYVKSKAYMAGIKMGEKVVSGEFFDMLSSEFPSIDDRMKLKILHALEAVMPKAAQGGLKAFFGTTLMAAEPIVAFARTHPEVSIPIAAILARKPVVSYLNWRIARSEPHSLVEMLRKRGEGSVGTKIASGLKLRYSDATYSQAHDLLNRMHTSVQGVKSVDANLGLALEGRFKSLVASGMGEKELAALETELLAIRRTAAPSMHADLDVIGSKINELRAPANAPVRRAIGVTARPFAGRIVSVGVPLVIEAIGAYTALTHDLPEAWRYGALEQETRGENKQELADVYSVQKKMKYVDLTKNIGSGAAMFYYMRWAKNSLSMGRAAGRSSVVLALGTEAIFAEAHFILDNIEKNMRDVETTGEEARGLDKKVIEDTLDEYRTGQLSWGQFVRCYSLSRWIRGDTPQELESESDGIRRNFFEGFMFNRLFQKAQAGDVFSLTILTQMFERDGAKKPGGEVVFHNYMNDVGRYLEKNFGTRNDIFEVSKKQSLEGALKFADLYANMCMDLKQYNNSIRSAEPIEMRMAEIADEMGKIQPKLAFADDEEAKELQKTAAKLQEEFSALQAEMEIVAAQTQWHHQVDLGKGAVLGDLAFNERGEQKMSWSPEELKPHLNAYHAAKEGALKRFEKPAEQYAPFMKRVEPIYEKIKTAGTVNGQWFLNQHTYGWLMDYYHLLEANPTFDQDFKVRSAILTLPGVYWPQYPGKHPYQDRFDAVRKAIVENYEGLKARKYEIVPVDRSKIEPYPVAVLSSQIGTIKGKTFIVFPDGTEQTAEGDTFIPTVAGRHYVYSKNAAGVEEPGSAYEVYDKSLPEYSISRSLNRIYVPSSHCCVDVAFKDSSVGNVRCDSFTAEGRKNLKQHFNVVHMSEKNKGIGGSLILQRGLFLMPLKPETIESITFSDSPDAKVPNRIVQYGDEKINGLLPEVRDIAMRAIKQLGLKAKVNGVYEREGYGGYYFLQPDGSIFWQGGKTPTGEAPAQTYFDGTWVKLAEPLNEYATRIVAKPASPFYIPTGTYEITVGTLGSEQNGYDGIISDGKLVPPSLGAYFTVEKKADRIVFQPKNSKERFYRFVDTTTGRQVDVVSCTLPDNRELRDEKGKVYSIDMSKPEKRFPIYIPISDRLKMQPPASKPAETPPETSKKAA